MDHQHSRHFGKVTRMKINERKSSISVLNLDEVKIRHYQTMFPFKMIELDIGLKYLGFQLKPNYYKKEDWLWLITKLEKR